jgi:ABC-type glycerol-3-phosphate transport system permease component
MVDCQYGNSVELAAGRAFWFTCMILTLRLTYQVQILPQYILFNKPGWVNNTYLPLINPARFWKTPPCNWSSAPLSRANTLRWASG